MAKNNVSEMPMAIVVDDGSRRVPIQNKNGDEIGVFYFRPTDIGIIERYNSIASKFDEITKPLEAAGIRADGTADPEDAASVEALHEAEKRLYEAVDYLFGGNMAEAFFGTMSPFSPVNGHFYCETAIEAVGNYISAQFQSETDSISRRAEKYTKGLKK